MNNRKSAHKRGLIEQPRDLNLFLELGMMRIGDADQLMRVAGFHSKTRINARLLALFRAGLLRRFFLGSGGGRKALYALSPKGAQLIQVPCRGPRRKGNTTLVADFFVQHQLAVNAVYCDLKFGAIPVEGLRFVHWLAFHEPVAAGIALIPDGYVEFSMMASIDASFIEVDLGHESLAVWKEKAKHYLRFAMSGEFERQFKHSRFRVLVLANSERRLHGIRAAVASITPKIFWFATMDGAKGEKFFASVWLRPAGETYQPLFKEQR